MMPFSKLKPFRYRIIVESKGKFYSTNHLFYAPNQKKADKYAKDWARRRRAIKLTRIRKESQV
jgi:hypothetical protein